MRTPNGGPLSATRILAVTIAACGFLFAPAPALAKGRAGDELAQPARKQHHHARSQVRPADEAADPAGPKAKTPAEKPSDPEGKPSDRDSKPDEDEEVSPGDSPASCDGCELAGFALGGSLWGLFGVARRRGVPRTVIRGLQPR